MENRADFVAGNPGCNDEEGEEDAGEQIYSAKEEPRALAIASASLERLGTLNMEIGQALSASQRALRYHKLGSMQQTTFADHFCRPLLRTTFADHFSAQQKLSRLFAYPR